MPAALDEYDEMGPSVEELSNRAATEGVVRGLMEVEPLLNACCPAGHGIVTVSTGDPSEIEPIRDATCEDVASENGVREVRKALDAPATTDVVAGAVRARAINPGSHRPPACSAVAATVVAGKQLAFERAAVALSTLSLGGHAGRPVDAVERRRVRSEGRIEQLERMRIYEGAATAGLPPSTPTEVGPLKASSRVRWDEEREHRAPVRTQRLHARSAVAVAPAEAAAFCVPCADAIASHEPDVEHSEVVETVHLGMSRALSVLVLFSGRRRPGDLPSALRSRGHDVTTFELLDADDQDLSVAATQAAVVSRVVGGEFDFVFLAPPCSSFSIAIEDVLRTVSEPEGVSTLSDGWRSYVQRHNELAWFAARVCYAAEVAGVAWAIENPAARDDGVARWDEFADRGSIWHLKSTIDLARDSDASRITFAQCQFSAPWQKYTSLLVSSSAVRPFRKRFAAAVCRCAKHDLQAKGNDVITGESLTARSAAYPPLMCEALADAAAEAAVASAIGRRAKLSDPVEVAQGLVMGSADPHLLCHDDDKVPKVRRAPSHLLDRGARACLL